MTTIPRVTEWNSGNGFYVFDAESGTNASIPLGAEAATLQVLLERKEDRDAMRFRAIEDPNNPACVLVQRGTNGPAAVKFWTATCPQAFPLASQLAHQLNQLEGLA